MQEQLTHLLKFCENPNSTLQIIPFNSGEYWTMGGSLTLITSPRGTSFAYVESFGSGELVDSARKVVALSQKFDIIRRQALTEADSLALVREYIREYR